MTKYALADYQKHIADTHADRAGKTLCGVSIGLNWVFMEVDHAFQNARNEGRLVPCPDCLSAVLAAFKLPKATP